MKRARIEGAQELLDNSSVIGPFQTFNTSLSAAAQFSLSGLSQRLRIRPIVRSAGKVTNPALQGCVAGMGEGLAA